MDIYEIRKANLIALIGNQVKRECAERWEMAPAHLSQLLSDKTKKNLGDDVARRIEDREGLPRGWLDTLRSDGEAALAHGAPAEPNTPSESDYALIPQYTAKGDCGNGYLNDHVEVNGGLAFKREWLRRIGAKPENCYVIYADGDSMEPYIFEGDVVLFDTSCVEPIDQKVYAIRRSDGGISIKRLVRQISGGWLIRSDSTDKARYPDEPVSDAILHEVPIVGRVIWRGGGVS